MDIDKTAVAVLVETLLKTKGQGKTYIEIGDDTGGVRLWCERRSKSKGVVRQNLTTQPTPTVPPPTCFGEAEDGNEECGKCAAQPACIQARNMQVSRPTAISSPV